MRCTTAAPASNEDQLLRNAGKGLVSTRMPDSLEQLDLLLMQEVRARKVRRNGIHFQGLRYLSLTLAAYVGEEVTLRCDPRDIGEIRVFYKG